MKDAQRATYGARLNMRDLDAFSCLQFESMCSRCITLPLGDGLDLPEVRAAQWFLTTAYMDIQLPRIPVDHAFELEICSAMSFGLQRNSRWPDGRLAMRCQYDLMAVARGADGESPRSVGTVETVGIPVLLNAPDAGRFLRELPPGLEEFVLHELGEGHPTPRALAAVAHEEMEAEARSRGVWGMHESDVTGLVYTGDFIGRILGHVDLCLFRKRLDPAAIGLQRLQVLFRAPFRPHQRFELRGQVGSHEEGHWPAVCTMHYVDDSDEADDRPAVVSRLDLGRRI